MTDLEMTKLCAEAMGWNWKEHGSLFISSGTGPWEAYDPLHDDAQAMALVKKFDLMVSPKLLQRPRWFVSDGTLGRGGYSVDLNRAIVECVAKLQAAAARTLATSEAAVE